MKYDLEDRFIAFAVQISDITEKFPDTRLGSYLAGQLIRSGCSPALNYGEAQAAESRNDFIHKMKLILKELRESMVSLKIAEKKNLANAALILKAKDECNQLIAIVVKSIDTTRKNIIKATEAVKKESE